MVSDVIEGVFGVREGDEPRLCWCGEGYEGHVVHEDAKVVSPWAAIVVDVDGAPLRAPDYWPTDGNALGEVGAAKRAFKNAGATREYCDRFVKEAMSGSYDHLIATIMAYRDARSPIAAALGLDDDELEKKDEE